MKGSPTQATPGSECASQVDSGSVPRGTDDAHTGSKELRNPVNLDRITDLAETRDVRPVDKEHVERLSFGVDALPPIDVVKTVNGFGILAGYHRAAASRLAGKKTIGSSCTTWKSSSGTHLPFAAILSTACRSPWPSDDRPQAACWLITIVALTGPSPPTRDFRRRRSGNYVRPLKTTSQV